MVRSSSETAPPPSLDGLTGLRFFAAFHVALFHYGEQLLPAGFPARFGHGGRTAVSLFFILSGFVLTYNYGDALADGRIGRRSFWLARFARVYPLYFFLVLVEIPISLFAFHLPAKNVQLAAVAHLALLQPWIPKYMFPGNVPGWSIGAEAFFYLLFPWLVTRFYRSPRRTTLLFGMTATWLLGMAVAAIPAVVPPSETLEQIIPVCPLARVFEFAFGIGLARLWMLDRDAGRSRRGRFLALPAILLAALLTGEGHRFPGEMLNNGGLAPLYGSIIYGLASGGAPRLLATRPLVVLGEASYALYLVQQPLFHLLGIFGMPLEGALPSAEYLIILVVVSIAVRRAIERPLQRLLRGDALQRWALGGDRVRDLAWVAVPALCAVPLALASPVPETVVQSEGIAGVIVSGYRDLEQSGGTSYRWTDGCGVTIVPVGSEPPPALRVRLQSDVDRHAIVEILVNGNRVYQGEPSENDLTRTFALDGIDLRGSARIEVRSSKFRPVDVFPESTDTRWLGVRVLSLSLE